MSTVSWPLRRLPTAFPVTREWKEEILLRCLRWGVKPSPTPRPSKDKEGCLGVVLLVIMGGYDDARDLPANRSSATPFVHPKPTFFSCFRFSKTGAVQCSQLIRPKYVRVINWRNVGCRLKTVSEAQLFFLDVELSTRKAQPENGVFSTSDVGQQDNQLDSWSAILFCPSWRIRVGTKVHVVGDCTLRSVPRQKMSLVDVAPQRRSH